MAKLQTYQSQVESPGSCHRDLNAFKESVGRRDCKQMFPTGNSMEIDTPWRRLTKRKPRKHDESCSLQQSSRRQGAFHLVPQQPGPTRQSPAPPGLSSSQLLPGLEPTGGRPGCPGAIASCCRPCTGWPGGPTTPHPVKRSTHPRHTHSVLSSLATPPLLVLTPGPLLLPGPFSCPVLSDLKAWAARGSP